MNWRRTASKPCDVWVAAGVLGMWLAAGAARGDVQVSYRGEGVYGVALDALAEGLELEVDNARTLAADGRLVCTVRGEVLPAIHDAARDRLVFHGPASASWYTPEAAVRIGIGEGGAMPRRDPGGATKGISVFSMTAEAEQDQYPFDGTPDKASDFFYWEYIIAGNAAWGTRSYPLDLTGYAGGDVVLRARLMGWTGYPTNGAQVLFNGQLAGAAEFGCREPVVLEMTVPEAWVSNGVNTVTVTGCKPEGAASSCFIVDGFEAAFSRSVTSVAGTLHFEPGAVGAVSAAAFDEPLAVALDAAGAATWIADANGGLNDKGWFVQAEDARYAVIEAADVPLLTPRPLADGGWIEESTNRIDYLVVTSRELEPAAQALADYRAGQGLRVRVVAFEDICDWMTDGQRTPEAVPALLARAHAVWAEAPWLVLLAGGGHYDYLDAFQMEPNHVPPLLVETFDGLFAADSLAGDLDGDGMPDVAVGRLPARTAAELAAMTAKIQAYEQDFGADWEPRIAMAADVPDPDAGDFPAANNHLAGLVAEPFELAVQFDLETTDLGTARSVLQDEFNGGVGVVHYAGHGTSTKFSSQGLLTTTDVQAMTNDHPPVVVALCCLAGRFEAPGSYATSLAEALLQRADGGAVAVWASSGLPRLCPCVGLGEAFYTEVLQEGCGTLGLAVLRARRAMNPDLFTRDTYATYNLLGDPALRIAGNLAGQPEDETFAQWRWQRLSPEELASSGLRMSSDPLFGEYALGGGFDLAGETPEYGFELPEETEPGKRDFILRWRRRVRRSDLDYRLVVSTDLTDWDADSPELEELDAEPDPDGEMETVRTRIRHPDSNRVFVGLRVSRN